MGLLRLFDPRVLAPAAHLADLSARRRAQREAHEAVWINYGPTVAGPRGALAAEAAQKSTSTARHDLIHAALRDAEQREFAGLPPRGVESLPSAA